MEAKVAADSKRFNVSRWWWWLVILIICVLVFAAGLLSILNKLHRSCSSHHLPTGPTNVDQTYATALELALQFFDIQKSGKLQNSRVSWRGDSGLRDGSEANLDLSKGMYDAGDLIKFGFPMAFTATVLSWAILEYGNHLNAVKQLEFAQGSLKWITDYLINAHPFPDVLYIQVGDPEVDHNCWERPETMTEKRPLIQVNSSFPGSDIAAETSAALAAASLVYKGSWLYHATREPSYLNYVTELNENGFGNLGGSSSSWFSWDDKHTATQHAVASAFLAVVYSDYMVTSNSETLFCSGKLYKPGDLRNFAISQADYVLGKNPVKMSYVVGYGSDYPQYVHHRGSSIPRNATTGCRDGFTKWNNSMQGEPTTYNAALMVALLSGLVATSSVPNCV
ncbi:hypothetical protein K1719_009794 [Acacia pycnantha]|nr:hypothetical protein K1719_009794 [Acacia pycnantha]